MIALIFGTVAVILAIFYREAAEVLVRAWVAYKRVTGYSPRRHIPADGPRYRSTVISKREWEEVAP
jgi:hypothetical protein